MVCWTSELLCAFPVTSLFTINQVDGVQVRTSQTAAQVARKEHGDLYKASTYRCLFRGLQRHLHAAWEKLFRASGQSPYDEPDMFAPSVHVPSLLGLDQPQAGINPKLCNALNLFGQNLSNGFNNILQNCKGD